MYSRRRTDSGKGFVRLFAVKILEEMKLETREILERVKAGKMSVNEAESFFRRQPFEELGYARLDTHRKVRSGFAEVVFCSGKADEHLCRIYERLYELEGEVLGTRASNEQALFIQKRFKEAEYDPLSRILKIEKKRKKESGRLRSVLPGQRIFR